MNKIHIQPSILYFASRYLPLIILISAIMYFVVFFKEKIMMISVGSILLLCLTLLLLSLIIYLFYKYIDIIFFTKWMVTEEQLIIKQGIIFRNINYIELYRIVDYQEEQLFLDTFFGLKSVYIHSGDKLNGIVKIFGIPYNSNLIDEIRNRVEIQRQIKSIYELTNRL